MNCPNCGKEVRGHFCTSCGTRVDQAPSEGAARDATRRRDPDSTSFIRKEDVARLAQAEAAPESNSETHAAPPSPAGPFASPTSIPQPEMQEEGSTPPPMQETVSAGQPFPSSDVPSSGSGDSTAGDWGPANAGWRAGFGEASVSSGPTAMLQPMSLRQIISATFDILRARMPQFLGVGLVYAAAMFVAGVIFSLVAGSAFSSGSAGASFLGVLIGGLILFAVAVVAGSVAGAAYINISRGDENTQSGNLVADTQAIIQRAMNDAPRLFLALLLFVGILLVGSIIVQLLARILGPIGGLISLAWAIAAIWYEVTFIFTPQAAVIDGQTPVNAMNESRDLVTGYWWRTLGYTLVGSVMLIPGYIVAVILIIILALILSPIPFLSGVAVALVGAAVFSAFYAFIITYLTLMFYDLKARKAGMTQQAAVSGY